MLDALRFVAAAVAKKDYVPELTHFKIHDGRVTGFNGVLALSSDIDVDLDIRPHASKLLAAIRACQGTISLNMTPQGKLAVKSGAFKSFVDCLSDEAAEAMYPEGKIIDLGDKFLAGIKALAPAMGVDASRPWSMGIKLQRQSMFATNNVMLVEYWHGEDIPLDIVIPAVAVEELLRIGDAPTKIQVTENSISFWFSPTRWMKSVLLQGGMWPIDKMEAVLSSPDGSQIEFVPGFFEAVETLKPFLGESGALYVTPTAISTSQHDGEGTSVELAIPGVVGMQAYHYKQLSLLGSVARTIDWTAYPRPCMFRGELLRGAVVGQRV